MRAATKTGGRPGGHGAEGSGSPLDAALDYAAAGYPVLPVDLSFEEGMDGQLGKCRKKLHIRDWPQTATTDQAAIKEWWERWPDAAVGIVTGERSGLAVVDLDVCRETGEPLGEQSLKALGIDLSGGISATTPSGGRHVYFKHVPGVRNASHTEGPATGIDVRGEGGFIIAPPSQRPDGKGYRWDGPSILEEGTAPFPADLRTAIEAAKNDKRRQTDADGASRGTIAEVDAAEPGGFFRRVNEAALADIGKWAPDLFPGAEAQPGTGAWRVSSAHLGRDLEEDLSIHPDGIKDFGEERSLTPIDLVMTYGSAPKATDAALWLCDRLGLSPEALGWNSGPTEFDGLPSGFRVTEAGIEYADEGKDDEPRWHRLCSPIRVVAGCRDNNSEGWGLLVEVTDRDGIVHRRAIPMSMFAGDGTDLRSILLGLGLRLASGTKARHRLSDLLQQWQPEERVQTADRYGWADEDCRSFILGNGQVLGDGGVVFQADRLPGPAKEMRCCGSVDDWRDKLAHLCVGNRLLVLAVSMGFAAPLLEPLGHKGGGVHLRGESSRGKTSALRVAASVWGAPGLVQSWRATDNGIEGIAAACNGTLLCLDEMGQVDPHVAGEIAYMLSNGCGKARSTRSGVVRRQTRWRLLYLSSGELSLADKMADAGSRRRIRAGQEVRLLDIKADGRPYGLFDDLHGHDDGAAFSDALKRASEQAYGTAGPAFVEFLLADKDEQLAAIRSACEAFVADVRRHHGDLDGQALRAAERLALIAAAGETATVAGLTGWPEGEARGAALVAFDLWLEARGGTGAAERRDAIERTRAFLVQHGTSRFEAVEGASEEGAHDRPVIHRAGWRDGNFFYVDTSAWKEIHSGADPQRAARYLKEAGLLEADGDGHLTRKTPRTRGGQRPRAYAVRTAILGDEGDE